MYLLLLCGLAAIVFGVVMYLLGAGWLGGIVFGVIGFVVAWIFGARRLGRVIQPQIDTVQRQIQAGNVRPALQGLEKLLPMGKWMPLLEGQLRAQMGFLHFQTGDKKAAANCLALAGRRAAEAKMLLAAMQFQDGNKDQAFATFAQALPFNRKHAMLHNVYAWLLAKSGRRDDAIAVLSKFLVKNKDQASTDNRLRLQNGQKMKMDSFGMTWFALGLERPPASMGQMQPRKGFRQPPKSPKRTG